MANFLLYGIVVIYFLQHYNVNCDQVRIIGLNDRWTLSNQNGSIKIGNLKLPSGVYSALAKTYGDILFSKNDDKLKWIAYENWTYTTTFKVQLDNNTRAVNITFHGIDTVAKISLNDQHLGVTDNMFLRYSFDVLPYLQTNNTLKVELKSSLLCGKQAPMKDECYRNMFHKMKMSYGIRDGPPVPSTGIWKPVQLEYYEVAIMRDIMVTIGQTDSLWLLDVRVPLETGIRQDFYGELLFLAAELLPEPMRIEPVLISYKEPQFKFQVNVTKDKVSLWWPNGLGEQKLYPLYISVNCWLDKGQPQLRAKTTSQKMIKIGFRTIELIEDLDDYGKSFYFKVNKQTIFIKGANYVPVHILPEHSADVEKVKHILKSAKNSHLNMIRVWDGGLYESDYFYSLADTYGLLVWQDITFLGANYSLINHFKEKIRLEIRQNIMRFAHHPSLALMGINNEMDNVQLVLPNELAKDINRREKKYRQAFGNITNFEFKALTIKDINSSLLFTTSVPSGLARQHVESPYIKLPNLNFTNAYFWEELWNSDIYPRPRFITRYGLQSLPILSSWKRSISEDDEILDLITYRQRQFKGLEANLKLIRYYFGLPTSTLMNCPESLIYFSQLSQAMTIKTATEIFRSQALHRKTMGTLYWHLNDVWVTLSSSSIDFYGNYKLLYYWSKKFLAPNHVIAVMDNNNNKINVTVTHEGSSINQENSNYKVIVNTYTWMNLYPRKTMKLIIGNMNNGLLTYHLPMSEVFTAPFNTTNSFLEFTLQNQNDSEISRNYLFPGNFQKIILPDPKFKIELSLSHCIEGKIPFISYSITTMVEKPALFVSLEIYHPDVERYTLSENGFVQVAPVKVIHLELTAKSSKCINLTADHVRIMSVNQFIANRSQRNCPTKIFV
uniref:beta-mannosidase n=1 Tax=Glossina pallidipes TaxID=7398 RepID=A0A1A9Z9Y7_GLOPL